MSYSNFSAKVEGLNDIQARYEMQYGPGNYIPPVTISFYGFRVMVGAGMLMIFLALLALFLDRINKLYDMKLILKLLVLCIALPYVANTAGWILTEVSRTPWIVFGLLKLEQAVSPTVSALSVLTSLVVFTVIYTALMAADLFLMFKYAKKADEAAEDKLQLQENKEVSLWI